MVVAPLSIPVARNPSDVGAMPGIGTFELAMRAVDVIVAEQLLALPFGEMEKDLAEKLENTEIDGLLGTDILQVADVVLSTRCRRLAFVWHKETRRHVSAVSRRRRRNTSNE